MTPREIGAWDRLIQALPADWQFVVHYGHFGSRTFSVVAESRDRRPGRARDYVMSTTGSLVEQLTEVAADLEAGRIIRDRALA